MEKRGRILSFGCHLGIYNRAIPPSAHFPIKHTFRVIGKKEEGRSVDIKNYSGIT